MISSDSMGQPIISKQNSHNIVKIILIVLKITITLIVTAYLCIMAMKQQFS